MKRIKTLFYTCSVLLALLSVESVQALPTEMILVQNVDDPVANGETVRHFIGGPIDSSGTYIIDNGGKVLLGATSITFTDGFHAQAGSRLKTRLWGNGNAPPLAFGDLFRTVEVSTATEITIPVLANDWDADAQGTDPIEVMELSIHTQAAHGNAIVGPNPGDPTNPYAPKVIKYTPNTDFSGTDSFRYTIIDGAGDSDTTTVIVMVFRDAPAFDAKDDAVSTDENVSINNLDVLFNDTFPNIDDIVLTTNRTAAQGVVINADKTLTYTPPANFSGTDSFTYSITDNKGGTDAATVTIAINADTNPPVPANDAVLVSLNTATSIDVLANDAPASGLILSNIISPPANGGSAVIAGNRIIYTPTQGFSGNDPFTYEVKDVSSYTATATVTPLVYMAVDDYATVSVDTSQTLSVLANDYLPANMTIEEISLASQGGTANISVDQKSIEYTPAALFSGVETFTYTVQVEPGFTVAAQVKILVADCGNYCLAGKSQTCDPGLDQDLNIVDVKVDSNDAVAYFATDSITAGTAYFTAEKDSSVDMGSKRIVLKPGFHAKDGSSVHIFTWIASEDTTPPAVGSHDPEDGSSVYSPSDQLTFTVTYADNASGIRSVKLFDANNGDEDITCGATVTNTTLTYTIYQPQAGTYNFKILLEDFVGNTNEFENDYNYSFTVTLDDGVPTTSADIPSGVYNKSFPVTLTCDDTGATIYYATDGEPPVPGEFNTRSGTHIISNIPINQNTNLKFFAIDMAGNVEAVKTENYVIDTTSGSAATPGEEGAETKPLLLYEYDALGRIKRIIRKR